LSSAADSLCLAELPISETGLQLMLFIGLNDGKVLSAVVERGSGRVGEASEKKIGNTSVRCVRFRANGYSAVLALSSRPWVAYVHLGQMVVSPVCCEQLAFALELVGSEENMLAITSIQDDHYIKVMALSNFSGLFNSETVPLTHSPRRMAFTQGGLALIESDRQ
jgi:splicing factor 3B subunit 3